MIVNSPRKRPGFPSEIASGTVVFVSALLSTGAPGVLDAQGAGAAILQRILLAEDRRARGAGDLEALTRAVGSSDTVLVFRAARALGRLERPELAPTLLPLLGHLSPAVRGEAVLSMAQALQGPRRAAPGQDDSLARAAVSALEARAREESSPGVLGRIAFSLSRLAPRDGEGRARAERLVSELLARSLSDGEAVAFAARGAEILFRAGPPVVQEDTALAARLAWVASRRDSGFRPGWLTARRRALGALIAAREVSPGFLEQVFDSVDEELRRLAVSGLVLEPDPERRERLLARAARDGEPIVRREALRVRGRHPGPATCAPLADALADPDEGTRLLAIDVMGTACPDTAFALARLAPLARRDGPGWRVRAHAMTALARLSPGVRRSDVAELAEDPVWQARMYAARAAGHGRDTALLTRLAADSHHNVREAALTALSATAPSLAYRPALAALSSRDYQLVLAAAGALEGAPDRGRASRALFSALDRITLEGRETSRDIRAALIHRLRQAADSSYSARLAPRLRDFDPVIAESAAAVLGAWTGRAVRPRPARRTPEVPSLWALRVPRTARLLLVMASGDSIEAELFPDEAPFTVYRVLRLARAGYYDGLTFHRVVPNFVIQGGSPGANEYAGDGPFMRDELGPLSHERGTFGISTRGRDTGDAQIFVNLVDNSRLDYDYTVWARVTRRMDALDRIGEGDVIRRIEVR